MRLSGESAPSHLLALAAIAPLALLAATPESGFGAVPPHDHVVVVAMENKSYDHVREQPYAASLIASGASFSSSYGTTHPSQPNYFALWAVSTLGVTSNNCPAPGSSGPHRPRFALPAGEG